MISAFAHKKVLVYGDGVSGKAAAKLLDEKGARVFVYDDKKTETEFERIKVTIQDLNSYE